MYRSRSILMPLLPMMLGVAGLVLGKSIGRHIEASNAENNSQLDPTANVDGKVVTFYDKNAPAEPINLTLASGRKIEDLFKDAAGNSNAEKVNVIFDGDTATLEKNPRGGYLLIYEKK